MMKLTATSIALLSGLAVLMGTPAVQAASPQPAIAQLSEDMKAAIALHDEGIDKLQEGDVEGAISDFSEAIKAQPRFSLAYYHRGRAQEMMQNLDAAIKDYTQAIQVNENWGGLELPAVYVSRGNARDDNGDPEGALSDYSEALKLNKNYGLAYENRGITYIRLNKRSEALQNLKQAAQSYKEQGLEREYNRVMQTIEKIQSAPQG